jgi:hypothetical protein
VAASKKGATLARLDAAWYLVHKRLRRAVCKAHSRRLPPRPLRPEVNNGAGQTQMSAIALIDTRFKIPGESIGTVVSTHETIRAAFKANEAFQKRMRDSGVKDHVPTKIVTLKVRLGDGEHVNPGVHLFQEGERSG